MEKKNCFLCGIGGSGVSALVPLLIARGWSVSGSDRSRDKGDTPDKFRKIESLGVRLYPQDGSGISAQTGVLIVSSAVEETIPDVKAARQFNVHVKKRAEILAGMMHDAQTSIAIGGTSGKSTTTAMAGWILSQAGKNPTIVNGAVMANSGSNAVSGGNDFFVAEVDESDGSISLYRPTIAILTNISVDHKPMTELRPLFADYLKAAKHCVVNLDDAEVMALAPPGAVTFSIGDPDAAFHATDIRPTNEGVSFTVRGIKVDLKVPGRHNVANALAAIATAHLAGLSVADAAKALATYSGIKRRFEYVGTANGVTVIDDFAHNPDKIAATLSTLHEKPGRVIAFFQPHGFGPTKLMKDDLIKTFANYLHKDDILVMPEIYYAGGTAARSVSSKDITDGVAAAGKNAAFFETRPEILEFLKNETRSGDRVVIMGARDDTLPEFATSILKT